MDKNLPLAHITLSTPEGEPDYAVGIKKYTTYQDVKRNRMLVDVELQDGRTLTLSIPQFLTHG